ncbi:MAG: gliding motility-associated ABC transporter permease subunit GldF [Sinomicrobium sp.]|nr:gliding motility-associated ABC transporter permease subunit GldF [Sinomicrobium sp.]
MNAIIKKEIASFFASPAGYLIIAVFLLLNGLFLWVFKTSYNVFDSGFADLTAFFGLAPWIFIFLIPAVSMKSFSEEQRAGTLELLLTRPLSLQQLVSGKFLGVFTVVLLALLPSLVYVAAISTLSVSPAMVDLGSIAASYSGLLFLTGAYTAIGIFASALSRHQIVAFITAVGLCFSGYYGFEGIAALPVFDTTALSIANLGMKARFESMSRGVLDTRDMIYFLTVTLFFLFLTRIHIKYATR